MRGTGVYFHVQASKRYDEYKVNKYRTADEFNSLYDKVTTNNNLSRAFMAAGAVVWLADITGVYLRGRKNK